MDFTIDELDALLSLVNEKIRTCKMGNNEKDSEQLFSLEEWRELRDKIHHMIIELRNDSEESE